GTRSGFWYVAVGVSARERIAPPLGVARPGGPPGRLSRLSPRLPAARRRSAAPHPGLPAGGALRPGPPSLDRHAGGPGGRPLLPRALRASRARQSARAGRHDRRGRRPPGSDPDRRLLLPAGPRLPALDLRRVRRAQRRAPLRLAAREPVADGCLPAAAGPGGRHERRRRRGDRHDPRAALPVMLLVALAIRLTSRGPVLYTQTRVGKDGRPFTMVKFRTMHAAAERTTGPVLASENDPRVTWLGRSLRAARLDELPQLWNLLVGDMSFVGPRPESPEFVGRYEREIQGYAERLKVRAGLTGYAQVNGEYHTSAPTKLKYDLAYIYNRSLWLDLKILSETVKVMLTRRGI